MHAVRHGRALHAGARQNSFRGELSGSPGPLIILCAPPRSPWRCALGVQAPEARLRPPLFPSLAAAPALTLPPIHGAGPLPGCTTSGAGCWPLPPLPRRRLSPPTPPPAAAAAQRPSSMRGAARHSCCSGARGSCRAGRRGAAAVGGSLGACAAALRAGRRGGGRGAAQGFWLEGAGLLAAGERGSGGGCGAATAHGTGPAATCSLPPTAMPLALCHPPGCHVLSAAHPLPSPLPSPGRSA